MDAEIPSSPNRFSGPKLVNGKARTFHPAEVLKEVEKIFLKTFGDDKHWIVGNIASEARHSNSGRSYFDIESDGLIVHASVPVSEATDLIPGTKVHVHGRLTPRIKKDSVDATIVGNILSKVHPKPPKSIILKRHLPVLSLSQFIAQPDHHLVILGTSRAINDLDTQLRNRGLFPGPFTRELVRITSEGDVLREVRRYAASCCGVLLVRGGGDEDGFRFWNDPRFIEDFLKIKVHFYLALGHADNQTDLDPFADEVFATPTEAGFVLAESLKGINRQTIARPRSNAERNPSDDTDKTSLPILVKIIIAFFALVTLMQMCRPNS